MECNDDVIRSVLNGNKEAFRQIVECYQGTVLAICINILKDYHEAENAAQETFIQIYNSLSKYEFRGFKTWIGKIATNKAIDVKRRMQSMNSYGQVSLDENIDIISNADNLIEDKIIKAEETIQLQSMCIKLPYIYNSIITKYYIQSKSYEQISREEGISIKTVESRLYRAKKILRENWEEGG